jgi:hypothetical protein
MSIILATIAIYPDKVLCEHTDYSGNFQQISRLILQKVTPDSKKVIIDNKYINFNNRYKFHYINENKITYMCLSDGINDETAFAFLNDVRKKFLTSYDYDKVMSMGSFQIKDFPETLKQLMVNMIFTSRTITTLIH